MENLTINSFDFDNMVQEVGQDPFAVSSNKYAEDTRFYKLSKDKEGNGGAVIRFLPDRNKNMIMQVNKINTTIEKNGKKRFVNELSPQTIGLDCPFQEEWARLWNLGQKEESKKFGRAIRYYTNIKVIKDPLNPLNEGKIFLLDMSGTLKDKIQKLVSPSQADKDLGAVAKQLFNPIKGNSFRLVCKKGTNGITNFDSSDALVEENSIYNSMEEAFEDIKNNTYNLNDFKKPETYLSYEKLQDKLKWVMFTEATQTQNVQAVPAAGTTEINAANTTVAPSATAKTATVETPIQQSQTQSLDAMLEGLL